MNSTQNKKIVQVKETTMIIGIDVGSEKHYFRAFNWRGIEVTRKPVSFTNSKEGFDSFYKYIVELMQKNNFKEAMVGFEPTGHYWFDLGQYLGGKKSNLCLSIRTMLRSQRNWMITVHPRMIRKIQRLSQD